MSEKRVWQYTIPSGPWGGWACIMIREDGFFATVSDYGNYAYLWTATGKEDVREFFLEMEKDWHYFAKKLNPTTQVNDAKSFAAYKESITERHKNGDLTNEDLEERLGVLDEADSWEMFLHENAMTEPFCSDEPWAYTITELTSDVTNFTQKIGPQLAQLIRDQFNHNYNSQDEYDRHHT